MHRLIFVWKIFMETEISKLKNLYMLIPSLEQMKTKKNCVLVCIHAMVKA